MKIHLIKNDNDTVCGLSTLGADATEDVSKVTCKRCINLHYATLPPDQHPKSMLDESIFDDAEDQGCGECSCYNCLHFHPAIPESRSHPEDPADCGHPKSGILTHTKAFPLQNGCKNWEAKFPKKGKEN